jgi:succinoglycan biosynthesis protein ExoM
MKITICIITYKRPEGLVRLLKGLDRIHFIKCEKPIIDIIIVDNDISGVGLRLCQEMKSALKWPIRYFTEIKRGISYARNKAVESVDKDSDFIAFIDDDELPGRSWLDELLFVQYKYDADVVTGPVFPFFVSPVPVWIERGGFFDRVRYQTGQLISYSRTGNVLIRKKLFEDVGKFDERLALTGGEDTHFFMRVHLAGYKIVWSDEAIVQEWIPSSKTNTKWLLLRAFRTGNNFGLCIKDLYPLSLVHIIWIARGLSRIFKVLLSTPFIIFVGRHHFVKYIQSIFNGAGIIAGMVGVYYEEYRKTHGD